MHEYVRSQFSVCVHPSLLSHHLGLNYLLPVTIPTLSTDTSPTIPVQCIVVISRACETIGGGGGGKSLSLVSKRSSFFGNAHCLSNFREFSPAGWNESEREHILQIKFLGFCSTLP